MKKAVLFDLDGTLLNSLPDISACMNRTLEKYGLPAHPLADYCYMTGDGARVLSQRAVGPAHADLVEDVLRDYRTLYGQHSQEDSFVYDGIHQMLRGLKVAGLQLAVLSNKDDPDVRQVMTHYFDAADFALLRGRVPGVPLKPDPAPALAVARELGVQPGECWYLGDTNTDAQTALGAGMHFVGAGWGFRTEAELRQAGARFVAQTPLQALDIMLER